MVAERVVNEFVKVMLQNIKSEGVNHSTYYKVLTSMKGQHKAMTPIV